MPALLPCRLVKDAQAYDQHKQARQGRARAAQTEKVEVRVEDFEARARELNLHELSDFYKSDVFRKRNFEIAINEENSKRTIVKSW